jgi:DNA-binding CsgD family transcriptional regulator
VLLRSLSDRKCTGWTQRLQALGLTRRQADVFHLITRLRSPAEITGTLDIAIRTVHHQLEAIYRRLGVCNRNQAVTTALHGNTRSQPPNPD